METRTTNKSRQIVIVETPPTPNGDLHIGHLAGPFLAADVHARYLRARNRPVIFSTGTDDSQTYVMASARRRNVTPASLAAKSREEIEQTLRLAGISIDGYAPYDDQYRSTVLNFVSELYRTGKLQMRTVRFPWAEHTGEFLVEGLVAGYCPICVTESRGGVCEVCGHPNNFDELMDPWSTVDPNTPVTFREARILVLPMEQYRKKLTAFYAARDSYLRPRTTQFLREALARPLPDFPITYPITYGIPSPFPETEGQTINAWVEGIPAVMYCTAYSVEQIGDDQRAAENLWLAENDAEIIYFIGSDIVYFWGLTHLALLMAHEGRYALPDMIISNEFYELDNEKFSTSRGHVVYLSDLLTRVSRDVIRFHLALTGPEHQRTNFSRDALDKIAQQRLVGPWNLLADALNEASTDHGDLPVSADARARAKAVLDRFVSFYELRNYSPSSAADLVVAQLERLQRTASRLEGSSARGKSELLGDLFLELRALIAGASPILIDLAEQACQVGGWDGMFDLTACDMPSVKPFSVPVIGRVSKHVG